MGKEKTDSIIKRILLTLRLKYNIIKDQLKKKKSYNNEREHI